jgi:hypothetical protein
MPHFHFELERDGKIREIYKDGVAVDGRVRLEMSNSIVQTYFSGAWNNVRAMVSDQDPKEARHYGLQAFLMSLVGLEAFVNVYFHRLAIANANQKMHDVLGRKNQTIEGKLGNLPVLAFGKSLPDQKHLNRKMRELYNMRSAIVHPKLELSSLLLGNWISTDMVENFQQVFEDRQFVLESLQWCLLTVARIGLASNDSSGDRFLSFWTTIGDTNDSLSSALGVSPVPGKLRESLRNQSASNP